MLIRQNVIRTEMNAGSLTKQTLGSNAGYELVTWANEQEPKQFA